MASEEEVAASRRLLEDVTKTPTKTGDPGLTVGISRAPRTHAACAINQAAY